MICATEDMITGNVKWMVIKFFSKELTFKLGPER